MKKIVSVLVILALVCGTVFAVDVSASMRLGFNLLSVQDVGEATDAGRTIELLDLNAVSTDIATVSADAFTFSAGTQFGGFKINLNPDLLMVKSNGAKDADIFSSAKEMSFYLQWGGFKLAAGHWVDGIFFAEQCKKDHDDTNFSGQKTLAGLYKMGLTKGTYGVAFDNLVDVSASGKRTALYADYTLKNVLPGNLIFTAAVVDNRDTSKTVAKDDTQDDYDDDSDLIFKNSFSFRLAYQQQKAVNANVDLRFFKKDVFGFGVFVSPTMVKGMSATVGFTMIVDNTDAADADQEDGFGIDARVRYEVIKGLTLTEQFNYTSLADLDGGTTNIFNSFNALYKASDAFWVNLNFQFEGTKIDDADMVTKMFITPGCVIIAGDGCQLSTGVQIELNKNASDDKTDLAIPVIMRVKF